MFPYLVENSWSSFVFLILILLLHVYISILFSEWWSDVLCSPVSILLYTESQMAIQTHMFSLKPHSFGVNTVLCFWTCIVGCHSSNLQVMMSIYFKRSEKKGFTNLIITWGYFPSMIIIMNLFKLARYVCTCTQNNIGRSDSLYIIHADI